MHVLCVFMHKNLDQACAKITAIVLKTAGACPLRASKEQINYIMI